MTTNLEELPNIGPYLAGLLRETGIASAEALQAAGAVEAYARLRFQFPRGVTLNALWAMDAALAGIDWRQLSSERKHALKAALAER